MAWGWLKKLGKVALKVAPYAAMAIPGVGVPLGMALQGGLAAANAKASGGSWKQALLAGGIGAGTAGVGAKIPIGPSASGTSKFLGGLAGKAGSKGWQSMLGQQAAQIGSGLAMNAAAPKNGYEDYTGGYGNQGYPGTPPYVPYDKSGTGGGFRTKLGKIAQGGMAQGQEEYGQGTEAGGKKGSMFGRTAMPRGSAMPEQGWDYQDQPMNQYDQNFPNLATTMHQGRVDARKRFVPFQFSDSEV